MSDIPDSFLRKQRALLPEVSELQVVRHYTNLSRKNFAIDTQFYPLGSCTMKYNPRGAHRAAMLPGFLNRHPLAPESHSQGYLACIHDLQQTLMEVTGMKGVSLTPMAGAQGEFAGVAMIRAYHEGRKDFERTEMLIPSAAHGTNPATAVMCGYKVREVPTLANGDVDLEALKASVGPQTAGLMMTNPSTCGVFEMQIKEIAETVHQAGGLLYYDGANLNAILGKVRLNGQQQGLGLFSCELNVGRVSHDNIIHAHLPVAGRDDDFFAPLRLAVPQIENAFVGHQIRRFWKFASHEVHGCAALRDARHLAQ